MTGIAVRDHYVYTAYDASGRELYIGCTKDLPGRLASHRSQSARWYDLAARFLIRGPYTYEGGRRVEREQLAACRPLFAFHPARRTLVAIRNRMWKREQARLLAAGVDFYDSIEPISELVDSLIPYPGNLEPIDVTDDVLRHAFAADNAHRLGTGRATA